MIKIKTRFLVNYLLIVIYARKSSVGSDYINSLRDGKRKIKWRLTGELVVC